jgi:signal transduction histidine kinase
LNIRKDGSEFPVYISSSVIRDENSKPLALIGVATDITARKQAEEKLELNNQELVKLHLEKDKFLSIIAHDLRGPFNGFLGLTNLMVDDLPGLSQEEIQKMAEGMRDSATSLLLLLENLLEWSRLQRGITSFEPESFVLMPMVTGAMRPVMDLANKKNIEISYDIPAHLEVFADQNMLASTIRNLATNAVKFTNKGGKVHISARSAPVHSVEFSVRDTGMGMNRTMVDDLFRLDVQTSRRGTEDEPSSGLGLLLCKDFIEKHGGKIWVESVEGKGSIFYFTLPYNTEKQEQSAITRVESTEDLTVQIKPLKILIAEDDYTSNFLITSILKNNNHEILHVNTGIEAIEVCRNNPDLSLVLMDIRMPEMGGYEATQQIRKFNKDVIIIAQTAFGLSGDRQKAIESGCNDYISKPIIKDELLRLIRKYLSK